MKSDGGKSTLLARYALPCTSDELPVRSNGGVPTTILYNDGARFLLMEPLVSQVVTHPLLGSCYLWTGSHADTLISVEQAFSLRGVPVCRIENDSALFAGELCLNPFGGRGTVLLCQVALT